MKPVLYGGAAARLAGVPAVVGALTGLGYVFSSGDLRARLLRPLVRMALRWALNGRRTTCLTQNPDDAAFVAGLGIDRHRIVVIPGSGVDTARFAPSPEPDGPLRATMVSRLLWDKGVGEFVEAARVARAQSPDLRFTLIGAPDEGNPAAVPLAQLEEWRDEGLIDWQGRRGDIPAVWKESHIAVLPSYYAEGLPKALLEAASCGRPIVAADVPGSREIARDGESGLLVPPRDPAALAAAILRLADDPALRARLGARRASPRRARILRGSYRGRDTGALASAAGLAWVRACPTLSDTRQAATADRRLCGARRAPPRAWTRDAEAPAIGRLP